MDVSSILRRVLKYSGILAAALIVIGGGVGFLVAGPNGLTSALIGTGCAVAFSAITAGSVLAATRFDANGFFAVVMGSWLLKMVLFIALMIFLRDQPYVEPMVLFVSLIVAIVGTAVIDGVVVVRSRIPYVGDKSAAVSRESDRT
jgi:hypothetical protein